MNDPKLKLAMARLLPEKIYCDQHGDFWWWEDGKLIHRLLETEWLYVMHLVEQELYDWAERDEAGEDVVNEYLEELAITSACRRITATLNQRATAMCKVKGIEV